MVIVTRAGHGGTDAGAANPYYPDRPEKVINLEIDEQFAQIASSYGHTVYRQRTDDTNPSLEDLDLFARAHNAQVIIEFHCNWATNSSAEGYLYIAVQGTPGDALGQRIGTKMEALGFVNRGIYPQTWSRLRRDIPHVLTESGFLTNKADADRLNDPRVIRQIALAHAQAVQEMYGLTAPSEAPVIQPSPAVPLGLAGITLVALGIFWLTQP